MTSWSSLKLETFLSISTFSGAVTYHHDGTDTYSDNIIFRMSDRDHQVEFLFPIIVAPEDDEPPVVNVNTGETF